MVVVFAPESRKVIRSSTGVMLPQVCRWSLIGLSLGLLSIKAVLGSRKGKLTSGLKVQEKNKAKNDAFFFLDISIIFHTYTFQPFYHDDGRFRNHHQLTVFDFS